MRTRPPVQAQILVPTSSTEDEKVYAAIEAGALGYVLKDAFPQEILAAIREVCRGAPSMSPAIAQKLVRELHRSSDLPPIEEPLAGREVENLKLVAHRLPNPEIAEQLVISERTVGTHVSNILGKLHPPNRTQAARYAWREGLAHAEHRDYVTCRRSA